MSGMKKAFILSLIMVVLIGCAGAPSVKVQPFSDIPDLERLNKAIKAVDDFFNQIKGVQGDEIKSYSFGKIELILWGSKKARDAEYRKRHGQHLDIPGYAFAWVGAGEDDKTMQVEAYVPFKRLPNGEEIIHPWALQHEVQHAIDEALRLAGRPDDMSDPDQMVTKEFWRAK